MIKIDMPIPHDCNQCRFAVELNCRCGGFDYCAANSKVFAFYGGPVSINEAKHGWKLEDCPLVDIGDITEDDFRKVQCIG